MGIKEARETKGWTQQQLVQEMRRYGKVKVTLRALQYWESGRSVPHGKRAVVLSDLLDLPLRVILTDGKG